MSIFGVGNRVGLVAQMQPKGDLDNSWIMFDHVKQVISWKMMAYHVYDSRYCKVMTITICDMQTKNTKAQQIMWTKLNRIIFKHGYVNLA